jgi:hypothetical protein
MRQRASHDGGAWGGAPALSDPRIPIAFGVIPDADDIVLATDFPARLGHTAGCACCAPRGAAAEALTKLFLARTTGRGQPFNRVVITSDPAPVLAALAGDPLVSARFRLEDADGKREQRPVPPGAGDQG